MGLAQGAGVTDERESEEDPVRDEAGVIEEDPWS